MGILDVSLSRASFLSAASFQNTTRMLIKASIYGAVDRSKVSKRTSSSAASSQQAPASRVRRSHNWLLNMHRLTRKLSKKKK
jgi:hypothetical protein